MEESAGQGDQRTVARRVLRLVTFALLFVLAVLTGMLVPASWLARY